jgi:hypothetical protein
MTKQANSVVNLRAIFASVVLVTGASFLGSGAGDLVFGSLNQHKMERQEETGIACTYDSPDVCTSKLQKQFNSYTHIKSIRSAGAENLVLGTGLVVLGYGGLPKKKKPWLRRLSP